MPTYAITIGGASKDVRKGSLTIDQTLNALDTLRADVVSADGSYRPAKNAEVIVTEDGTKIFAGPIQTARERWLRSADWDGIVTTIEAVDWTTYAQRRIVSETLTGGTLKSMLTTLVTNYLATYSVTLHASQANGPTLPDLTYTDQQLSAVLEDLATRSGYVWKITYDKELYMWAPGTSAASYDITSANGLAVGDIVVEPTNDDFFANTVYVDVTGAGPATSTETFTAGGGTTETYTTAYPASQSINDAWPNTLIVNSVNQGPVKWGDPDVTFAWGWDYTTNTLKHNGNGYVPALNDVITITYAIGYPFQVSATDATSVAAIGPWEVKIRAAEAVSETAAQDLADAELTRRLADLTRVRYETYATGAIPGDTQTINVTERNINATYLITDITLSDVGRSDQTLKRTVTAVESQIFQQGWRNTVANWTALGGLGGGVVAATGGSGGNPALPFTSVQFNDDGGFGGSSDLTWDDATKVLQASGSEATIVARGDVAVSPVYGPSSLPSALHVSADGSMAASSWGNPNTSNEITLWVQDSGDAFLEADAVYSIYSATQASMLGVGSTTSPGTVIGIGTSPGTYTQIRSAVSLEAVGLLQAPELTTTPVTISGTSSIPYTTFRWNRSSAGTVNLPALSAVQVAMLRSTGVYAYRLMVFHNVGTAWLTLDGNSSETIDGAATKLVAPGQRVMLSATASGWLTVGETPARITVTLTDAQVKALPTTPVSIVPAPGSGYRIVFKKADLLADFATAAYTNINATTAFLYLSTNGVVSDYIADDSAATPALTYASTFLDNTKKAVTLLPWRDVGDLSQGWGSLASVATGFTGDNQALTLVGDNNGSGDWTGGNAANALRVSVEIGVEATS